MSTTTEEIVKGFMFKQSPLDKISETNIRYETEWLVGLLFAENTDMS